MAWAPQLGNTSCLPPRPECAQPALKAHFVSRLHHQMSCVLCSPSTLPVLQHHCSQHSSLLLPCLVKCTSSAKPFTVVLLQPLLSTHLAKHSQAILPSSGCSPISCTLFSPQQSCPWSQQRSTEAMFGDSLSRHACFHCDTIPWPCTTPVALLLLLPRYSLGRRSR